MSSTSITSIPSSSSSTSISSARSTLVSKGSVKGRACSVDECKILAKKKCSACKIKIYCSQDCQNKDLSKHKKVCLLSPSVKERKKITIHEEKKSKIVDVERRQGIWKVICHITNENSFNKKRVFVWKIKPRELREPFFYENVFRNFESFQSEGFWVNLKSLFDKTVLEQWESIVSSFDKIKEKLALEILQTLSESIKKNIRENFWVSKIVVLQPEEKLELSSQQCQKGTIGFSISCIRLECKGDNEHYIRTIPIPLNTFFYIEGDFISKICVSLAACKLADTTSPRVVIFILNQR